MFAAASSLFSRTNISQSYNIGSPTGSLPGVASLTGSRPATPGSTSAVTTPLFFVGLWKVQSAWHKVTSKRVSVWTFDKRGPELEKLNPVARERAIEVLKAEGSSLGRLRHPSILEMVEPLEETRSELVFATEPILSSLGLSIPDSGRKTLVELDEVEIQKGFIQLCKGLAFLHNSAKLIHSNLCPESVVINGAGDWKISGLGLTIPLQTSGAATRWQFPTFDGRIPAYVQRSFDYMAPEYALDEQLVTASDMYSLGCVMHAVHKKGEPPFKNHGSLGGLRENSTKSVPGLETLDPDLRALLRSLITRQYGSRPTPETLPSDPFFSSLPISTLNFLDRSNFTAKTREEKISFMKGLTTVLDRFSEGLRTRKILPSLLEEMKDTHLLPYILPNVFAISQALTSSQFATQVLPNLKPLFAVKEPPQNMLTLLDNLTMLQEKTDKQVFREHVLVLVYNALESEHAIVQERALKTVPGLCDSIDFAEVQSVLFPRVASVFGKTHFLSVKVATLETFLAMVKTLDQLTLTQKLVPILSKIRTKEPAVMMATLSVQEAMGFKVEREAVATLVLPQLWSMSMGPLLSVGQFQRFMSVIKRLGDRVEKEHDQFLRDSQRVEDRSGITTNGANETISQGMDFESLVGRSNTLPTTNGSTITTLDHENRWDDDDWGNMFGDTATATTPSPPLLPPSTRPTNTLSIPAVSPTSTKFSTPVTSFRAAPAILPSTFPPPPMVRISAPATNAPKVHHQTFSAPNYNISLTPAPSSPPLTNPLSLTLMPLSQQQQQPPLLPAMGGVLTPSRPTQSKTYSVGSLSKDDWASFDPLS